MWLTVPFFKLISDPLIAARSVSVLAGLGTTVGIFVLTYLLFERVKTALFAGLIYSILPFAVFFDRLALVDSLLAFFGVWMFVFLVLTVHYRRLDTAMLAGFALGGALLTKSPGVYFAVLAPVTLVIAEWPREHNKVIKRIVILAMLFGVMYLLGYGLLNILRLGPDFHMIALRNADYVYPLSHIFTSPMDPLKPFFLRNLEYIWILGTPPFILLTGMTVLRGGKRYWREMLVLITLAFAPIVISSEFSKTMTARYIFPSVPFLVILAAMPIINFTQKKGLFNVLYIGIVTMFVIWAGLKDFKLIHNPQEILLPRSERSGYLEDWTSGYGIKEVSEVLRMEYFEDPVKKIVVGTEGYFGTLPDGLKIYLNDLPDITVIGVGQPIKVVPESLVESKKSGNKTFLVVNSTRLLGKPEELGLSLIAEYEKAERPDGVREKLLFFRVDSSPLN